MLKKTEQRTRYIFLGLIILCICLISYYILTKPSTDSPANKLLSDVSLFKTHGDKNILFVIHWKQNIKESSANNKNNFRVENVKFSNGHWENLKDSKKITIQDIQYVYSAWVDTEEKRKNASEPHEKVTQLFAKITPKEEIGDNYKVTVNNIESTSGEIIKEPEFSIVKVTKFNELIKR